MNEPNASTVFAEPAGFWRRVGAFLVDCLILGIAGLTIAFALRDVLSQIGVWGRLVGFTIALLYFGLQNSRIAGGQTLGKRLLGIKVVDLSSAELSLAKSFLRSGVFQIPWFLNGAAFSGSALLSLWLYPLAIAVFGLGLSIVYLFLFNRPYRRSLHDLAIGTVVVRAPLEDAVGPIQTWRPHFVVCALLIVCSAMLPALAFKLAKGETFGPMLVVLQAVSADPAVLSVTVNRNLHTEGGKSTNYMAIQAQIRDNTTDDAALAKRLAEIAANASPQVGSLDLVQVTLVYGFDIGIASSWNTNSHQFEPASLGAK